jgi:hypothetical protein
MTITDLVRIIPPDKLTPVERAIFARFYDTVFQIASDYTRACFANSSGLRGDGGDLEPTLRPVNPYRQNGR